MRGPAPVARLDDIALAGKLGPGGDVVEVATDRQRAVAIGLDEALDEVLRAGGREIGEIGLGHLGEGDGPKPARTDRREQLRIAQIGGDDLGDLAAERAGIARGGVGRLRGRHIGDRNRQGRAAAAGDIDDELPLVAVLLRRDRRGLGLRKSSGGQGQAPRGGGDHGHTHGQIPHPGKR